MQWKWQALIVAAAAALWTAGCGSPGSKGGGTGAGGQGASATGKKLRLAVIPKMLNNPVFGYARVGAERAAKQLGNVEIEWTGPQKDDPLKQASTIDAMVNKGVDGIVISCSDPQIPRRSIDRAVAAGIPVITFDSDSPGSKRQAYYGVNDLNLGRQLGRDIAAQLKGRGAVAILSGVRGALNLQMREKGVRDELKNHAGIKIIDTFYCDDDLPRSEQIMRDVTRSRKPAGWVLVGGWPLFTRNGLSAITPGKTRVVSVDPLPDTWKWIEKNYVQVCLGQKVFGWGEEGVKLCVRAINGEKLPVINDSGFDVVTPANLAQYKKQWALMAKPA